MMKVLADAELILSAFQENEHTKDAEKLLTRIMPSEQIELYITDLCLSKIRYYDEYTASLLEERFRDNILLCDNCLIKEQVFQSTENTRNFECAVETACAIAYDQGAFVTHKPEDFIGSGLLVWSVDDLLIWLSLGDFVCQVLHKEGNFIVPTNVSNDSENRIHKIKPEEIENRIHKRKLEEIEKLYWEILEAWKSYRQERRNEST